MRVTEEPASAFPGSLVVTVTQATRPRPAAESAFAHHLPLPEPTLMCACSVAQACLTLRGRMNRSRQSPLSLGFSRQECWSGLTFPSPGDLPNPGIEPTSSALADTFLKPHDKLTHMRKFYITRCSQKHPRIASLPKGTNQFHQKENFCFFLLGAQP